MSNNISLLYGFFLLVGDFIALLGAFVFAYIIRVQIDTRPLVAQIPARQFLLAFLALLPFWLLIFALLGLYNRDVYERRYREIGRLLVGTIIGIMGIITYDFISNEPIFPARLVPLYAWLLATALVVTERILLRGIREQLFKYKIGINKVLLVGKSPLTGELARLLSQTAASGYQVKALCASNRSLARELGVPHYQDIDSALQDLGEDSIQTILQTEIYDDDGRNRHILETAQAHHIAYKFVPANHALYTTNNRLELFHNFPVVAVHATPLVGWGRIGKRIFDVIGSILGILVASPILLVAGLLIKMTDPKYPVFYKHQRVTRFGVPFYVYKLRSMYGKYSPGLGAPGKDEIQIFTEMGRMDLVHEWKSVQKVTDDPRIMWIGQFIRKTSIDELPQLVNVLRGELSLIGPRPITKQELERYESASSLFLSVKPGITGLWQVSGRNQISYQERIELELYYVQNWSILLDIKILYRTVLVMLGGKGQ